MRVDKIIKNTQRALEQIVRALTHNISASENLSGEGSKTGQVLSSTGPNTPPVWEDITALPGGTPPTPVGPPFKPLDAGDLVTGTVPPERLTGEYPGITRVGVLTELRVNRPWMHAQAIVQDTVIPAGWGSPLVGPIDVTDSFTFDIQGSVAVL